MALKQKPGYFDVVLGIIHSTDTSYNEYRRSLDEDRVDADYRLYLLDRHAKQKNVESKRKQRENEDGPDYKFYHEGKIDPQYELFLGRLKEDGNSYILESLEHKGKFIKYEGGLSSDTECDQELRRKPSAMKQRDGPSRQMPRVENQSSLDSQSTPSTDIEGLIRGQTRNQSRSEKIKNAKLSTKNTVPHSTYPRSTPALKELSTKNTVPHSTYPRSTPALKESSLDRDCDPEPERPRVENQSSLDSQSTPRTDIEGLIRRQTRSQSRSEKEKNAKLSTKNTVPHSTYPHSTPALKESSLDRDCDPEPERMLRSGRKPKMEQFNQMCDVREDDSQSTPTKEILKPTRRNLKNKPKREKEDDIVQLDPDYFMFSQNLKVVNYHYYAYTDTTHRVVYELKGGESNPVKEEYNDGSYSDVEILDRTTFDKMNKSSMPSSSVSEFRHKVITALRKPFDKDELEKLLNDIKLRKPKERHLDLRNGRERSYGNQINGKSYLDQHPDFKKKLTLVLDDKRKFLNLLRGFFLWLKHTDVFSPWLDDECLAIYPESR